MLFTNSCAIAIVRDRSGRMLSAGTASASSRNPLSGVFRDVLFPQEPPPSSHADEGDCVMFLVCYYQVVSKLTLREENDEACWKLKLAFLLVDVFERASLR